MPAAKYRCIGWPQRIGCQHTWTRPEPYCGSERAKCPMCGNIWINWENYQDFLVPGM